MKDFNYEDDLPCGLVILDKNKEIIFFNEELQRISGINKLEAIGKPFEIIEFYQSDNNTTKLNCTECLKENSKLHNSVLIKTSNKGFKLVFVNAKIMKDLNTIISITDISEIIACDLTNNNSAYYKTGSFQNLVGNDEKMKELYRMTELAADSISNVLISGESGTGKELIARAIYALSPRKTKPFVAVNCSSLSETLLESELFGHVKGSFTGAYRDKIGKFEAADHGTIFLDEIGDISPVMQVKILRVLQEKIITKVGDNSEKKIDIRIIAATNKDLRKMVEEDKFREDLFYRLKVFPINTIALRERKSDIPLLSEHFINIFNKQTGKYIKNLSTEAMDLLKDYCWPGNVRELQNAIEHAFVICSGDKIESYDLPQELRTVSYKDYYCRNKNNTTYGGIKKNNDKILSENKLKELIAQNNGNKSETARQLGISRVALWKKLKKFENKD